MPFQKGQSGNPSGRPPKGRALTELLEKAGKRTVLVGGKGRSRARVLADFLWEAVISKRVTLPDGTIMELSPDDWWENVQFIYKQVDGPPKSAFEHSGPDGGPIKTEDVTNYTDDERIERLAAILERARQNRDRQVASPADTDGE